MFKIALLVISVAIVAVNAQEGPGAAPEPYSYGYETESHGAAESRDPNGKVTGYYTLTDADGRQRRVEYYADETGFHAKVQTNEVGTKSESSADVEIQAAPPTQEQLVYLAPPQQAAQQQVFKSSFQQAAPIPVPVQQQRYYSQQVSGVQQPARTATYTTNVVQQPGYGSYPGSYGYGNQYAVSSQQPGYYTSGSRYSASYNNHLPSSYYRSIQTNSPIPATYSNYRAVSGAVPISGSTGYQSSRSSYSSSGQNPVGSSNYIVLKKRASDTKETTN